MRTIETDPLSPFQRKSGDPPAEWIYRDRLEKIVANGGAAVGQRIVQAGHPTPLVPPFPKHPSTTTRVFAYANHGRWVWDCATPGCGGAQVCTPKDPRGFCVECWNAGDGWWPVEFPSELDQINKVLDARPADPNRNWRPGESVERLRLENVEHGCHDPLGVG